MADWVWAPEPFDVWFGPYDDAEPERARLQQYYPPRVGLVIVPDSKMIRRKIATKQEEDSNAES